MPMVGMETALSPVRPHPPNSPQAPPQRRGPVPALRRLQQRSPRSLPGCRGTPLTGALDCGVTPRSTIPECPRHQPGDNLRQRATPSSSTAPRPPPASGARIAHGNRQAPWPSGRAYRPSQEPARTPLTARQGWLMTSSVHAESSQALDDHSQRSPDRRTSTLAGRTARHRRRRKL